MIKTILTILLLSISICAQSAYKTSTEQRATTQTSNDSDLSLSVTTGVYAVDGVLNFACDPDAGFKFGFALENDATLQSDFASLLALANDTTNNQAIPLALVPVATTTEYSGSDYYAVTIHGTVKFTHSGTWVLVWAQRQVSETPTELGKGSYLRLTPVGP